jgi:hypothetical protein
MSANNLPRAIARGLLSNHRLLLRLMVIFLTVTALTLQTSLLLVVNKGDNPYGTTTTATEVTAETADLRMPVVLMDNATTSPTTTEVDVRPKTTVTTFNKTISETPLPPFSRPPSPPSQSSAPTTPATAAQYLTGAELTKAAAVTILMPMPMTSPQELLNQDVANTSKSLGFLHSVREAPGWKIEVPGWLEHAESTKPPRTPGAFLHIGKTGGSTLSLNLRNGCHSWVSKPCKIPVNESYISQLSTYYHVPDFQKLNKTAYSFYTISLRDPLDRTLSAFTFMHPANRRAQGKRRRAQGKRHVTVGNATEPERDFFVACFPNLDTFVESIDSTIEDEGSITDPSNCTHLATGALQNRFELLAGHFYFDIKYVERLLPAYYWQTDTDIRIMVVRTEYLWHDWTTANRLLGQDGVATFPHLSKRNFTTSKNGGVFPVSKKLSETNQKLLCTALLPEYQAYLQLVAVAANLNPIEKLQSLERAHQNCPDLNLSFQPPSTFAASK